MNFKMKMSLERKNCVSNRSIVKEIDYFETNLLAVIFDRCFIADWCYVLYLAGDVIIVCYQVCYYDCRTKNVLLLV